MEENRFTAAQVINLLKLCDSSLGMTLKGNSFQILVRDVLVKNRPELKIEVAALDILQVRDTK